jgi:hypothetical protein
MIGLVAPVLLAVAVALMLGGSLDHWSKQRLRWWPLALLAVAIQIPLYSPPLNSWRPILAVGAVAGEVTMVLILVMLVRNAISPVRPALLLASLGVALNLTVIVANGGWMPRADARAPRELDHGSIESTVSNTAPMASDTRLGWLADTIAQPVWLPLSNLVSPGDLLLSFGAAGWAFAVTRRQASSQRSFVSA